MKTILLLLLFTLAACSKDKICWECDINTPSGNGPAPGIVDICNDLETQPQQYKDGQGNTYGGFECIRK